MKTVALVVILLIYLNCIRLTWGLREPKAYTRYQRHRFDCGMD